MDIVRDGAKEATNYFFSLGDDESLLELTFNHDGRTYVGPPTGRLPGRADRGPLEQLLELELVADRDAVQPVCADPGL